MTQLRRLVLMALTIGVALVAADGRLVAQSASGTAGGLPDLVGSFSLKKDGAATLRISKPGADYLWSSLAEAGWTPTRKADVVTYDKRPPDEQKAAAGILGQLDMKGASADQSASILKVAIGWQLKDFKSTTGYVLFTWFGPVDLYKLAR
jgi:hypothetical protein